MPTAVVATTVYLKEQLPLKTVVHSFLLSCWVVVPDVELSLVFELLVVQ